MQGITSLKKDLSTIKGEMEIRKANEPVEIPSKIRVAVKDFYTSGLERDMTWNLKKRYTDEDNFELTNYIKTSVQGIAPDTSEEVIHGAIKRYFTSKKEAENRVSKTRQKFTKRGRQPMREKRRNLDVGCLPWTRKQNGPRTRRSLCVDYFPASQHIST
ncbi:uncharacterized protein [Magallana gigas]|uniref:uncharacterized protein n=1 Tax=Magallana gigas TaxID=29159 RepID=UPI0033406E79